MKTSEGLSDRLSSNVHSPAFLDNPRIALARIELLAVLLALAMLALVALPALATTNARSRLAQCFNNLRQVGRASQAWASQNGDQFPWHLLPPEGLNNRDGNSAISVNPFIHFAIMSNELASPRVLVCPSDTVKLVAKNFLGNEGGSFLHNTHQNNAQSYFVGLDARLERPKTLLSGDRNIRISRNKFNGTVFVPCISMDGKDPNLGFTNGVHSFHGNVALTDGSVHTGGGSLLRDLALKSGDNPDTGAIGGPAPNNDALIPGQPSTIPE